MTKLTETVPLAFPLAVTKDGKAQTTDSLTVRRPKTAHVKRLAVLIGPALLQGLLSGTGDKVDMAALATDVLPSLLNADKLDAFTGLVADLASISPQEADELDPMDFVAVLVALAGFFPGLPSIGSSNSPPT